MAHIIIISATSWEGNYLKSTVELAKELSRFHQVWFMDYQHTWKDLALGILGLKKNIPWKQILGIAKRTRKIRLEDDREITLYTPPAIVPPFWMQSQSIFTFVNTINQSLALKPFAQYLRKNQIKPDVIMTALNPFMGLGVSGTFPGIKHVYYCFDEIQAAHYLKKFGGYAEERLFPQLDAAVFTSDYLEQKKGQKIKSTTVIKNGVHFENFVKYKRSVRQRQNPKIGYTGSIDDRFDIDMMEAVIEKLPEFEFHFAGRIVHEPVHQRLKKYSNVQFLPPVNADKVPAILGDMDVGIIPYLKNDFTVAVYPLKVNEYLSIGLPVVMTTFAQIPEFAGIVSYADESSSFEAALVEAVSTDTPQKIQERVDFASANSWTQKAKELSTFLLK